MILQSGQSFFVCVVCWVMFDIKSIDVNDCAFLMIHNYVSDPQQIHQQTFSRFGGKNTSRANDKKSKNRSTFPKPSMT